MMEPPEIPILVRPNPGIAILRGPRRQSLKRSNPGRLSPGKPNLGGPILKDCLNLLLMFPRGPSTGRQNTGNNRLVWIE